MINKRLSSAETAAQLGVKPATVYAYVSRGVLSRQRSPAGSTFDAKEVAVLARTSRHASGRSAVMPRRGGESRREATGIGADGPAGMASHAGAEGRAGVAGRAGAAGRADGGEGADPVFVTELTLIDRGRLYYRGVDAVALSRTATFEEVAEWLWTGQSSTGGLPWRTPPAAAEAVAQVLRSVGSDSQPVEKFMVAVATAALTDELRHALSPASVLVVGPGLLSTLVDALPLQVGAARRRRVADDSGGSVSSGSSVSTARLRSARSSLSARLWPRLSPLPLTPARQSVLEAALVLSADHELAPSTLAARVAAAFRADPYAVVSTGLGPASGSWPSGSSGAPSEVESLLAEALAGDPGRTIGERLRRVGSAVYGFGMPLYPGGDPRGAELLARLPEISGRADRHVVVERVRAIGQARGFPPPNVDLGLGALAFCGEMIPGAGQAIATLGKVAGWLAHAIEEYASPTRFRTRAAYIGTAPERAGTEP
ncbi:MAG TPA: citrate/2-methylcitrate synthase [Acidimicrobiales bacterium]|jgi:citrate synthase